VTYACKKDNQTQNKISGFHRDKYLDCVLLYNVGDQHFEGTSCHHFCLKSQGHKLNQLTFMPTQITHDVSRFKTSVYMMQDSPPTRQIL